MARVLARGARWSRLPGARKLALIEHVEQRGERPIEDHGWIAVRHDVPHEVLGAAQLVMRGPRDRQLHLVPFRGQRCDDGGPRGR
jgi:hypothetical protein